MEREMLQHIEISLGLLGLKGRYHSERTVFMRHGPRTDPATTTAGFIKIDTRHFARTGGLPKLMSGVNN